MKLTLFFSILILAACSPASQEKANRDADQVKEDVRRGFDKAKNSPLAKELTGEAKRGFHKADVVVTKELERGRAKVREKVNGEP